MRDIEALNVIEALNEFGNAQLAAAQLAADFASVKVAKLAPRPRTAAETGLGETLLQELIAKHLFDGGAMDAGEIALRSALAGPIVEEILGLLRRECSVEVRRAAKETEAVRYALTDRGRASALEALARDGYIGPAPVPLAQYEKIVRAQSVHKHRVTQARMRTAFSEIVLCPDLLDQLGAALHSGRAIFIYGPAGSGKTYISQRLARLLGEAALIPHGIAVGNTVLRLYDPVIHRPVEESHRPVRHRLEEGFDPRFVLCHRPAVATGGELTLDMLEVRYEPATRQHQAPLQLKATNGIYCIDDLGRQRVAPVDLFNRWIVPLDSGEDYLSLVSGKRFPVPFDMVLVFSTNLNPLELADEAFLRRIGHKIRFGPLSRDDYGRIWHQVCLERGIRFDPGLVAYVLEELYSPSKKPLLACHPRDLLGMALDQLRYFDAEHEPTPQMLKIAWARYFADFDPGRQPGHQTS